MGIPMTDETSTLLAGRYRLQARIGQGGMASVYRALDEQLGRDVAVKVFLASGQDQKDIDAQEAEMKLLASLNHHGVVTLLDAGVDLTDPHLPRIYLVMELGHGSDLQQRLSKDELSARQIAFIGSDLAEGLEYIHQRQIVHRDIKPANILVVADGGDSTRLRAKLTDFGIAALMESGHVPIGGITLGTAAYLSPEQVLGDPLGPPSDIYSLGLVLLECFTGKLAYPGQPEKSALARLVDDPAIPDALAPEWQELLSAMTARQPRDRPVIRDVILALRQAAIAEMARHKVAGASALREQESRRMGEVLRYKILDTPPDGAFDQITALAARLFAVPMAIVSIVDHDRIWFKSHHGLEIEQVERAPGLCASAILNDEPWVVENARLDPRALANPLVAGEFGLQFYAGVPLHTRDGYNLGTLCVLDLEPRVMTGEEVANLQDLAAMVVHELELRLDSRRALQQFEQLDAREQEETWAH